MDNNLIESDRLLLRHPKEEDKQLLANLFCDPKMMHYMGGAWTTDKVTEALQWWRDNWGVNNCWYGILLLKDTLEAIGTAGFTESSIPNEPGLELSWFVLPQFQRQGLATEITTELVRFAFDELKEKRLVAETHPDNPASKRVLEKLHFECLGERQHTYDYLPGFDRQDLWVLNKENWQE